jgi:phage gpG-like protein
MIFEVKFESDHLKRTLTAIRQVAAHPHGLLESEGEALLRVNRNRHQAGTAPDGAKWKPLSALTLQEKRRGGPLNKSGRMLQSFGYQVAGDTLLLGFDGSTDGARAEWHHFGTKPYDISPKKAKALKFGGMYRKRVHHLGLPARPLVGLPESDKLLIEDVAVEHLRVILNRVR